MHILNSRPPDYAALWQLPEVPLLACSQQGSVLQGRAATRFMRANPGASDKLAPILRNALRVGTRVVAASVVPTQAFAWMQIAPPGSEAVHAGILREAVAHLTQLCRQHPSIRFQMDAPELYASPSVWRLAMPILAELPDAVTFLRVADVAVEAPRAAIA